MLYKPYPYACMSIQVLLVPKSWVPAVFVTYLYLGLGVIYDARACMCSVAFVFCTGVYCPSDGIIHIDGARLYYVLGVQRLI